MTYKVRITNNETGEMKIINEDLEWTDYSKSWWTDGNFGCDCNRAIVFFEDDTVDQACGDDKFTVHEVILENGDIIQIDGDNK